MLKTTELFEILVLKIFKANNNEIIESISSSRAYKIVKNLS